MKAILQLNTGSGSAIVYINLNKVLSISLSDPLEGRRTTIVTIEYENGKIVNYNIMEEQVDILIDTLHSFQPDMIRSVRI